MNTPNGTTAHIARATMKVVTPRIVYRLQRMEELILHPDVIRLIGGGNHSLAWRPTFTDIWGLWLRP